MQVIGFMTHKNEILVLRERRGGEGGLSGVIVDPRGLRHGVVERMVSKGDNRQTRLTHLRLSKTWVAMMMMMMMMMYRLKENEKKKKGDGVRVPLHRVRGRRSRWEECGELSPKALSVTMYSQGRLYWCFLLTRLSSTSHALPCKYSLLNVSGLLNF